MTFSAPLSYWPQRATYCAPEYNVPPFRQISQGGNFCLEARAPFCFSDRPQKHKHGRGHWDLASCQVLLNSVQQFQRRSWKCLSQSETGRSSFFLIGPKNTNMVEDVEILLPVKFCWILFSGFRGEVEKCLSQSEARAAILFFPSGPKNINLVEDVEILLPVKFRWIPFRRFREVEKVSANQRPGHHLVFPICPKNTNLVEDVEILLPVKFRWILLSGFRGEVEKCLSQSEARATILFLWSAWKTQTW